MNNKKNKSSFYKLLFFLVGLLIVGFMVYKTGFDTILDGVTRIGWWFLAIMGVWLLVYVLNTISWRMIMKDENGDVPSFLKLLKLTISGFTINYITPVVALGGEPYRILELKDYMGVNKATSCTILYSMMHVFSHALFWMFGILIALFYVDMQLVPALLLILVFLGLVYFAYIFVKGYKKGLVVGALNLFSKFPIIGKHAKKFLDSKREDLVKIDEQITELHTHRRSSFYWSILAEFSSRIVGCLEVNIIVYALLSLYPESGINLLDAIIINAGYSLFANLVFFVPMQIGSREGGYLMAFVALGIKSANALAVIVSLITRIRELVWIVIGILLMRLGTNNKTQRIHEKTINENA